MSGYVEKYPQDLENKVGLKCAVLKHLANPMLVRDYAHLYETCYHQLAFLHIEE